MYINLSINTDPNQFKIPNKNPSTLDNHHLTTQLISDGQVIQKKKDE